MQYDLINVITASSYDHHVTIQKTCHTDLMWWINESSSWNTAPILPQKITLEICSDASLLGWDAATETELIYGVWTLEESDLHINILELRAAFF